MRLYDITLIDFAKFRRKVTNYQPKKGIIRKIISIFAPEICLFYNQIPKTIKNKENISIISKLLG
jgi:hypothetical protein